MEDAGNFFSPFPGHTGKINLALVTAGTHHLPEAFFGLHRKTQHGQVKILILPFSEQERGWDGPVLFANCFLQLQISSLLWKRWSSPNVFPKHWGWGRCLLEITPFLRLWKNKCKVYLGNKWLMKCFQYTPAVRHNRRIAWCLGSWSHWWQLTFLKKKIFGGGKGAEWLKG